MICCQSEPLPPRAPLKLRSTSQPVRSPHRATPRNPLITPAPPRTQQRDLQLLSDDLPDSLESSRLGSARAALWTIPCLGHAAGPWRNVLKVPVEEEALHLDEGEGMREEEEEEEQQEEVL